MKPFHFPNRVIYQWIELDLLYKTVYKTFIFNLNIDLKISKYNIFHYITFVSFFSILVKCRCEKSIAKNLFISVCSPLNSASNHILDILSKGGQLYIIKSECKVLAPFFTYFSNIAYWYLKIFFFIILYFIKWIIHRSIELSLLYKTVYKFILFDLKIE